MDHGEILRRLREATTEPYQLGLSFRSAMIAPVPQRCVSVDAGPLRLVVEARHLDDRAVAGNLRQAPTGDGERIFDDYGPTLHVYGADDGIEHLRFDCFANKPHYHYVREAGAVNIVCRLDQYADGDPIEWTIGRLRQRLPAMLQYCGNAELADAVEAEQAEVTAAIDEVADLLRAAREQALAER